MVEKRILCWVLGVDKGTSHCLLVRGVHSRGFGSTIDICRGNLLHRGNLLVMAEPLLIASLSPLLSRIGIVRGDSIADRHNPLTYEVIESNLLLDNGDIGNDNFSYHPVFEKIPEISLWLLSQRAVMAKQR